MIVVGNRWIVDRFDKDEHLRDICSTIAVVDGIGEDILSREAGGGRVGYRAIIVDNCLTTIGATDNFNGQAVAIDVGVVGKNIDGDRGVFRR